MGARGVSITSDDTVLDIKGEIVDLLKQDASVSDACEKVIRRYQTLDENELPLLWLAIALVQWKYGVVSVEILERVRSDIADEKGLELWKEDPKLLEKRKAALEKFLTKIESPNPKPSKLPKLVVKNAPFKPGDCLSIKVEGEMYTAAIVLDVDNSNQEYGANLVGCLDYLSSTQPTIKYFKKKNWLKIPHPNNREVNDISWYLPVGFKKEKGRFNLVGNIPLGWFKPKHETMYTGWHQLGKAIVFKNNA